MARTVLLVLAVALVCAGTLGLCLAYLPDQPLVERVARAMHRALSIASSRVPGGADPDLADRVYAALAGFPLRFVLAPLGLVLLVSAALPGRRPPAPEQDEDDGAPQHDSRALRKARKSAAAAARNGMPLEAAELCFAVDLLDEAAGYFIAAGELERAAEIRHAQGRFIECAELYARAGRPDAAAVIYAEQGEFVRSAEAYVEAGNLSVAAEMFESAGRHRRAAECYEKADIPRHAAKAYIQCEAWEKAATCLEVVMLEDATGRSGDERRQAEYQKLVRTTGHMWERAGRLERAEAIFVKAGLFGFAADIALKQGEEERAADHFLRGKDVERAAKVLEGLGQSEHAARIRAEHYRERGDVAQAAEQFEAAGEWLEAGDLFRSIEQYDRAGECYEHFGDGAQAAEMFGLAGDRERAAANYERAGHFAQAAECFALAGDSGREAELLVQAGQCLRAAEIHRADGRFDEAMATLQRIEPGDADHPAASALLGEMFGERGDHALAIAKLRDALEGREIDRDTVRAYFALAAAQEAVGDLDAGAALYEKVLAFDFRYEDAQERLARCREQLATQADAASSRVGGAAAASSAPGRYVIRKTLGRGGMGIVYEAEDTVLDRIVALKVLPEALEENPEALKNFLREAKSAAQLNHPNIVTVYDAGAQDGTYYIAMEYVDGRTLKEIIKKRGKIGPRGIVHVLAQMAEALAYAHEKKIVHRDIKNANAMWTRDRKAKIMDFGLARVIEEVRNHTTVVSGTPYYMSPEQTLGKNVDHRTDLYSLGVSVFEMATGTLPFTEGNLPYHHVHTPPPDPRELCPELPDPLARVILRCLRKDPAERYQSAREILVEIRSGLSE
jgi:tetratricopeptide (TPR) repeat protein